MINTRESIIEEMKKPFQILILVPDAREIERKKVLDNVNTLLKATFVVKYFHKKDMRLKEVFLSSGMHLKFSYIIKGQLVTFDTDAFVNNHLDEEFNRLETLYYLINE